MLVGIITGCLFFYFTLIYKGMTLESSDALNGNFVLNLLLIMVVAIIFGLIIYMILTLFEKKIFAKWLLGLSVIVILLTLFIFGSFTLVSIAHSSQQSYIATGVINVVKEKNNAPEELGNEIESLIKRSNHISDIKIYNIDNIDTSISKYVDNATPNYQYHRELFDPKWAFAKNSPYGVGDGNWYIEMNTINFDQLSNYILFSGVAIYWFLFLVWAILSVKHQNNLNLGWIVMFMMFNVLGYLLYKLEQVFGRVNTSLE